MCMCMCLVPDCACRYEGLQRQLVDAQAAAEIEEEEAELARAAAAVARMVAPEGSSLSPTASPTSSSGAAAAAAAAAMGGGGSNNGSRVTSHPVSLQLSAVESEDEGEGGPAAAKLRLLEQEVEEARQEVHAAPEDDQPSAGGLSMKH